MNKKNKIFNRMYEKMTPSREAEEELFARAAAIEREEGTPSADTETFGGIIMNRNTIERTHETELDTVRSRKGGIIAAAAALALVLGIGGYAALNGRGLDVDDVASAPSSASQPAEEESNDAKETVRADPGAEAPEYKRLTDEEALKKASELLDIPASEIIVETKFVEEDHGIEFYELNCNVDGKKVTFTIPTGYKTVPDEEQDFFMTETAAGQALTDAGIAHDSFEALAVIEVREGQDEGGWIIMFKAGEKTYIYMIDDTGKIVTRYWQNSNGEEFSPARSSDPRSSLIAKLLGINEYEVKAEDIKEESVEFDYGIEFSNLDYTYKGKEYHISIPTGEHKEPEGEQDLFMTETVSGMALEDAGIGHDGFAILAVCEDKFTRPDGDGKAEDKNEVLSGWRVIFLAGGKTYTYCIADTGEIVQKETVEYMTSVPEDFGKDRIAKLFDISEDEIKFRDIKVGSVEYDYGIEFYDLTYNYKDKQYNITIPTGNRREQEGEQDLFMTETVSGMALEDAGVAHDGFDILAVCEDKFTRPDGNAEDKNEVLSGWRIIFTAGGKTYTYCISDMGEIVSKETA